MPAGGFPKKKKRTRFKKKNKNKNSVRSAIFLFYFSSTPFCFVFFFGYFVFQLISFMTRWWSLMFHDPKYRLKYRTLPSFTICFLGSFFVGKKRSFWKPPVCHWNNKNRFFFLLFLSFTAIGCCPLQTDRFSVEAK